MASQNRTPGPETEVQHDPLAAAGVVTRRCPRVAWKDSSGPHEVSIDARTTVGSSTQVDLSVADPAVSRLHAEFELLPDGLWVRDLDSKNGTFLDGIKIGAARIPDGATVRVGSTDLAVKYTRIPTAVDVWPEESFGPLVGRSVAMRELFARLARVASTDSTVLIRGETGTGKELVARAIHESSPRAGGPFVVVDCAALPEHLLEAELFGHAKGAFTGAAAARPGALEAAEGGTVFLDEIGELPVAMQPKLLRAVESRTVRRLGETNYRQVNVRILSATHRDLRTMVNSGTFREDLYFRIAVLPIQVPPLRERPDDIPALVAHFLPAQAGAAVDPELLRELTARSWPGNVREVRNFVERAVALGAREALDLSPADGGAGVSAGAGAAAPPPESVQGLTLNQARARWATWTDRLEAEYIRELLALHGNNVSAAAQTAGVNRTYLHRLIRRHGL